MIYIYIISTIIFPLLCLCDDLLPECKPGEIIETSTMICVPCPANATISSDDGFSCKCGANSIRSPIGVCSVCDATHAAGVAACVPRRCRRQGQTVMCARCPQDHITVTENPDGSPMKEAQCIKCSRGFKAVDNRCAKCDGCSCAPNEVAVSDLCMPKKFLEERPKYVENRIHQKELREVMKNEFLCIRNDYLSCRRLAASCVRNMFTTDPGGPCRLWIQPNVVQHKGLPQLTLSRDDSQGEIHLHKGLDSFRIVVVEHLYTGGLRVQKDRQIWMEPCVLPINVAFGRDVSYKCVVSKTELMLLDKNSTFTPYILLDEKLKSLPVAVKKPSGYLVQGDHWPSSRFRRYFLMDTYLTPANVTNSVYLANLNLNLKVNKQSSKDTSILLTIEVQYSSLTSLRNATTIKLTVEHTITSIDNMKTLEIWCGVLTAIFTSYALVQWRSTIRRGGLLSTFVPTFSGAVADSLYFSALCTALQMVAESGTFSAIMFQKLEYIIKAFVYSAVALKIAKVIFMIWKQCCEDIFLLDWSFYQISLNGPVPVENWKATAIAREWSIVKTMRRTSPWYTATLSLVVLHFASSYQQKTDNIIYIWAVTSFYWWCIHSTILVIRYSYDKVVGSVTDTLPRSCAALNMSLIVFQEEYYAHYLHGFRNGFEDFSQIKNISGPLSSCRIVCTPQFRTIYKQLSDPVNGNLEERTLKNQQLTRFLAAFFERALEGMTWVCSTRTVLERLLNSELLAREGGTTSCQLLHDGPEGTSSVFENTWWSQEWSLATFDAMLFGCVVVATGDAYLSVFVVIAVWQIMKFIATGFSNKNIIEKTNTDLKIFDIR